ncbi:DedA family protein [Patescibacteria group bacterium]
MTDEHEKRILRARGFLLISIGIIAIYTLISFGFPEVENSIYGFFSNAREYALTHGLWGMFVFALAANATILLNIPYSAVAILLAGLGLNPFLVALVAGAGAVVGEVTGYLIGWGGASIFARNHKKRFDALRSILEKKRGIAPLIIFTCGALPIPDDIVIVPLGMIRYSFWRMIIPMSLGKIVQNMYFALIGYYSFSAIDMTKEGSGFFLGLATLVLILGAIYFVIRMDWDALLERWTQQKEKSTM